MDGGPETRSTADVPPSVLTLQTPRPRPRRPLPFRRSTQARLSEDASPQTASATQATTITAADATNATTSSIAAPTATPVEPPTGPPGSGDLGETVVHSALWVAFQKWGVTLSGLVTFTVLGRLLSPSQIGLAALATVFVTLFQALADQGFSKALIQKHTLDDHDLNSVFRNTVGAAVALTALTIALSPVASRVFHEPDFGPVLAALAPVLIFGALAGVPNAMLEREFRFRALSWRTLWSTITGSIVGISCAFFGLGVWSIVAQALTGSVLAAVVVWRVIDWRPSWKLSGTASPQLRSTGLRILGIEMIGLANAQADKLIVGAFLGPRDLGFYYVGSRIVTMITDVQTSVIEAVSLTTLSKLQKDPPRLRSAFYRLTSVGAASGIGVFAIVTITAPVLLPAVFGQTWTGAVPIMQILCVMGCLNAIIIFDRNALIATGSASSALAITALQCVVGLVAISAAVPFGVLAVALAVVIRQYAVWPFRLTTIRKAVGVSLRRYLFNWITPMLGGLAVFGLGVLVDERWAPESGLSQRLSYLLAVGVGGTIVYTIILRFINRQTYRDLVYAATTVAKRTPARRWAHQSAHARSR